MKYAISILLLVVVQFTIAGSGGIRDQDFGGDRTIIFAESSALELIVSAKVVNLDSEPFSHSGEGAVPISAEIFETCIEAEREAAGPNTRALIDRHGFTNLSDKDLDKAGKKDNERKKLLRKALEDEHKRVGLKWNSDTECVVHFYSGKAAMNMLEVYQGNLKAGDRIDVKWKDIQFRWSCPPVISFEGKCGWIFEGSIKAGDKVTLGHGFFDRKQAVEALSAYKKRVEKEANDKLPAGGEMKAK